MKFSIWTLCVILPPANIEMCCQLGLLSSTLLFLEIEPIVSLKNYFPRHLYAFIVFVGFSFYDSAIVRFPRFYVLSIPMFVASSFIHSRYISLMIRWEFIYLHEHLLLTTKNLFLKLCCANKFVVCILSSFCLLLNDSCNSNLMQWYFNECYLLLEKKQKHFIP